MVISQRTTMKDIRWFSDVNSPIPDGMQEVEQDITKQDYDGDGDFSLANYD